MRSFHLLFLLPLVRALDITYFFYKTSPSCSGQEFLRTTSPLGECARPAHAQKGELFSSVFGFASGIPDARVFVYAPVEGQGTPGDNCVGSLGRSDERWCGTSNQEKSISGARMMMPPGSSYPSSTGGKVVGKEEVKVEDSALLEQCTVGEHFGWHDDVDMFEIRADSDEGRHYERLKGADKRLRYMVFFLRWFYLAKNNLLTPLFLRPSYMKQHAHCHTKIGAAAAEAKGGKAQKVMVDDEREL